MNIIFQIDGGIGKSIAATAVCKAIKRQYPNDKLLVLTGYPEVFLCNPYVDRAYSFNNLSYFYEEHVQGNKVKALLHNPYSDSDFINLNGHLIEVWCKMFNIEYNGELPELYINERERNFFSKAFISDKPIFLLQTNGGAPNQPNKYSWSRDLPIDVAQRIVNMFAPYYNVLHVRRQDQLPLQNCTPVQADFRAIATLISLSSKRLFIDSFCQHAAAALGKPSVVCWVGNTPSQFGYEIHTNIIANEPTNKPELRSSILTKYNISGSPTEFPYNNESEIFDTNQIVQALVADKPDPSKSLYVKNVYIKDKIQSENFRSNHVASRLIKLAGKIDLSNVTQILDIGSWHLGQSVEFSEIFNEAKIDAFEPVPESFEICLNRLSSLDKAKSSRIRVHNVALSDSIGEIPFYVAKPNIQQGVDMGFSSMFKFNDVLYDHNKTQNEILVQSVTLDSWAESNKISVVDIMWIDVQGAELLLFRGADNILMNTKIIMTEVGLKPYYEGHTLKDDIDKLLFSKGFSELEGAFQLNGFDFEANTIYINNNLVTFD